MKKMKKLLALIMAMVMVLGMGLTASAAAGDDWTISISGTGIEASAIDNNEADELTIKYGQIVKEDRESTIGWQFVNAIETDFVNGWNGVNNTAYTAEQILNLMIAAGTLEGETVDDELIQEDNYFVENGMINSTDYNACLNAALASVDTTNMSEMESDLYVNVETTGIGLYIIEAQRPGYAYLPMAAYMNTDHEGVAVVAKGSDIQLSKTVGDGGESIAPGDMVTYKITQQYLYIAPGAKEKTFTITDTITNGTLVSNSVKVYYKASASSNDRTEMASNNYNISYTPTSVDPDAVYTGFVINFGGNYYDQALAGKTVEIEYNVTVGSVTDESMLTNNAVSSTGSGTIVTTKPVSVTITKVDADNRSTKLPGAKFQIYKETSIGTVGAVELKIAGVEEDAVQIVYGLPVGDPGTTDGEGKVTFNNLDAQGTYYVKEIEAPEGYSLNDMAVKLTGANVQENPKTTDQKNGIDYSYVTYTYTNFNGITITDTQLSSLPSTGGIGTTIFTIGGCVIMIAAAALYFVNRRKSEEN